MSILESVPWGKSALKLLQHTKELDSKVPAVIHIRHSERPPASLQKNGFNQPLTTTGTEASLEFGKHLPINRKYSLFHTDVDRTQMTCQNIQKGIKNSGGKSSIKGEIMLASVVNVSEAVKIIRGLGIEDDDERASTLFYRWVAGLISPNVFRPSLEFAQIGASIMMKNLESADSDDVNIWVSHENWVAAFLVHWLCEFSFDWITFLDGFILQFYDDHMIAFFRGENKKLNYPYWWNTLEIKR